jgi:hypothetical protein
MEIIELIAHAAFKLFWRWILSDDMEKSNEHSDN